MTLILVAGLPQHLVLVSDRRLTREGKPFDEEASKSAILDCRDARVALAFTGMAGFGEALTDPAAKSGFRTSRWMLETLAEVAAPDHAFDGMMIRFCDAATKQWRKFRAYRPEDKRTAFIFTGYHYTHEGDQAVTVRPIAAMISNFDEDRKKCKPQFNLGLQFMDDKYFGVAGLESLPQDVDQELRTAVRSGAEPRAVVAKFVNAIRVTGRRQEAGDLVGGQCSSIVLPMDPMETVQKNYHTEKSSFMRHEVSLVEARGGEHGVMVTMDPTIEMLPNVDSGERQVIAVHKVGRNKPCSCGSGKKFKRCCGRR